MPSEALPAPLANRIRRVATDRPWVWFTLGWRDMMANRAISLPLGRTDDGLPVGIMISGQIGDENTLLRLALQIEAAHPFRRLDQVGEAAQVGVPNRDEPGAGAASNGA